MHVKITLFNALKAESGRQQVFHFAWVLLETFVIGFGLGVFAGGNRRFEEARGRELLRIAGDDDPLAMRHYRQRFFKPAL